MVRWITLLASLLAVSNVNAQKEDQTALLGHMSQSTSNMTAPATEMALQRAMEMAKAGSNQTLTPEHVLVALLEDEAVLDLLANQNVEPDSVRTSLIRHLDETNEDQHEANGSSVDPSMRTVMQHAVGRKMAFSRKDISPVDLLVAILIDGNSFAASVLNEHGLTLEEADNESLKRHLAEATEQGRNLDVLRERIAQESTGAGDRAGSVSIRSQSSSGPAIELRHYTLRVTSEQHGEETEFKAAVSHDGRLDLYIESTPFETDFKAGRIAALFESIEADGELKVELIAEIEGQRRKVSGFTGTSGAIFGDRGDIGMQRSGAL